MRDLRETSFNFDLFYLDINISINMLEKQKYVHFT